MRPPLSQPAQIDRRTNRADHGRSSLAAVTRIMLRSIQALMLVAMLAPARLGAQDHALRGTVTDVTGGVIVGAAVELASPAGESRSAMTSNRGEYVFTALAPGAYHLRIVAPGFAVFAQDVTVPVRKLPLNVTLQ